MKLEDQGRSISDIFTDNKQVDPTPITVVLEEQGEPTEEVDMEEVVVEE